MRRLGIGEVCRLLDIKPHVLRYWEEEISFLEPEKNVGGRRMYGDRDLSMLYRLKFLITQKRLTVEGAKLALLEEMSGPRANEKAQILALRKNLLDAREALEDLEEKAEEFTGSSFIPRGQEHLREIWKSLPPYKRRSLSADLLRLPSGLCTLLAALHAKKAARALPPEAARPVELVPRKSLAGRDTAAADACLAGGRLALVTILPACSPWDSAVHALKGLARAIREGGKPYGKIPLWYIFAPPENPSGDKPAPAGLRTMLCREDSFFYDEEKVLFLRQPFFPYLDSRGLLCVQEDGHIAGYASGMAGVFLVVSSPVFSRGLAARGVDTLGILPANHFSLNFPDRELLAGHDERGAGLSLVCAAGAATGNYIAGTSFLASCGFGLYAGFSSALIPGAKRADELNEDRPGAKPQASFAEFPVLKARLSLSACRGAAEHDRAGSGVSCRPAVVWGIKEDE
ncbi:MAG: MerR family transcriptional regulator [Spirochaetia bacterium]|nr:MerR family transcriptional regulator [Spirochaetia bacterium]